MTDEVSADEMREMHLTAIRDRLERGQRLSDEDHARAMVERHREVFDKIKAEMKADREANRDPVAYTQGTGNSVRTAIHFLLREMNTISLVHTRKRNALEDRVAELERQIAALKPKERIRVKAPGVRT